MPGWFLRTVGYHIDDGRIFDAEEPAWGKVCEGEIIISKNFRQGLGLSPCYPVIPLWGIKSLLMLLTRNPLDKSN